MSSCRVIANAWFRLQNLRACLELSALRNQSSLTQILLLMKSVKSENAKVFSVFLLEVSSSEAVRRNFQKGVPNGTAQSRASTLGRDRP